MRHFILANVGALSSAEVDALELPMLRQLCSVVMLNMAESPMGPVALGEPFAGPPLLGHFGVDGGSGSEDASDDEESSEAAADDESSQAHGDEDTAMS